MVVDMIEQLCQDNNITVSKMLSDLNMGAGVVSTWRKRGTSPNGEALIKIAHYFNVTVDYLLGNTPDPSVTGTSYAPPIVSKDVASIIEHYNELSGNGKEKVREYIEMLRALEERKGDSND